MLKQLFSLIALGCSSSVSHVASTSSSQVEVLPWFFAMLLACFTANAARSMDISASGSSVLQLSAFSEMHLSSPNLPSLRLVLSCLLLGLISLLQFLDEPCHLQQQVRFEGCILDRLAQWHLELELNKNLKHNYGGGRSAELAVTVFHTPTAPSLETGQTRMSELYSPILLLHFLWKLHRAIGKMDG
ncbi:hypothetical protein C8R45DRAFT_927432 [Mycena sanguinolenta]|nr:hypothetical protein C8R45DRAFT_927432 [Mycena sanguinolenta]